MIRNIIFGVSTLAVFVVLNSLVFDKQRVVDSCESVYLPLAPVDPRSLMQGDYMRLDYSVSRAATQAMQKAQTPGKVTGGATGASANASATNATADVAPVPESEVKFPASGRLVLAIDKDGVATFVRFDDGTPLVPGQKLLVYHYSNSGIRLGAESYFFKEGDAKVYEKATFGELRVTPAGESVLMGLCDANRQLLGKRVSGL